MEYPVGMCSRYSETKDEVKIKVRDKQLKFGYVPRYNVAPSQRFPVIVEDSSGIHAVDMKWGWQPVWTKQLLINAQAETVTEKPTFRKYIHQRCLIPADGFYEWMPDKTPIRFVKPRDEFFCMAGLWLETQKQELDVPTVERKFVIITTTPNESVGRVHNRMPLIVQPEHYGWWLAADEMFENVLNFPDKEELNWHPVNRALNNPRNEGAELLKSVP